MNNYEITESLKSLRPGAEFVVRGDELSGIEWLDQTQTKPTNEEIVQGILDLESAKIERIQKRTALLEKLGINEEEVGLLLG